MGKFFLILIRPPYLCDNAITCCASCCYRQNAYDYVVCDLLLFEYISYCVFALLRGL